MIIPLALVAGFAAMYIASRYSWPERGDRPNFQPDTRVLGDERSFSAAPSTTGFSPLDRILDELKKASTASKLPLGLLVGWIAKESGGKLARHPQPGPGDTHLDERGYFQLLPVESKMLSLQHEKLSTDPRYSINGGLALVGRYMGAADKLDIAPRGSSYYWKIVKLLHSMGPNQVKKIVNRAKDAGKTSSWDVLSTFALGLKINGPQPKKWFPFVDEIFTVGKPFGFGNDTHLVGGLAGAPVVLPYSDIPDPLDVVAPRTDG